MDNPTTSLLNWAYSPQEKNMDDLRQSFLLSLELEDARLKAQEEVKSRDDLIAQLKNLLTRAIRERDEAQEKCQKVLLENLFLQQQLHQSAPHSGISSIEEDDPRRFSSSDCDESIVSSPRHTTPPPEQELPLQPNIPLPEKGKLLQAVIKAGPLLQTLLLAGPLPRWRHPPPPLDTNQIPPFPVLLPSSTLPGQESLAGCAKVNRKRSLLSDGSDSSSELKHQRIHVIQ